MGHKPSKCLVFPSFSLWRWPWRPSMFKHSRRHATTAGGPALGEALMVGPAFLLPPFATDTATATMEPTRKIVTEAKVEMVVMVVMAVLVAPPSTMANVVKDSLATILWLTQNLKATSLEVPPLKEDLFLGRLASKPGIISAEELSLARDGFFLLLIVSRVEAMA